MVDDKDEKASDANIILTFTLMKTEYIMMMTCASYSSDGGGEESRRDRV